MNDTTSDRSAEQSSDQRFLSLDAMNAAHADLLKRTSRERENTAVSDRLSSRLAATSTSEAPQGADNSGVWDDVERFVSRTCATGAILESDVDREAAQGMVTYWSNALYRANRQPDNTLLDEFDENACPDIPDDQCPYLPDATGKTRPMVPPGWQRLVRECLNRLEHNRIVAIVGQSGSGRGFLIYEGILPKLKAGAIEGSANWRILPEFSPQAEPLAELIRLISPQAPSEDELKRRCEIFRKDSGFLTRMLDSAGAEPVLLIVSRFDRFFSIPSEDSSAFFRNLQTLISAGKHRVILKIRSDYLAQMAADETLGGLLERNEVLLALTANELRQSIVEPARHAGLYYEPGLVDRLVEDVQGDPAAAQLLRFTLLQLWEHRVRNRITREAYARLGGGRLAVERAAERIYQQQIKDRSPELPQHVWTTLVRLDVGRDANSQRVSRLGFYRELLSLELPATSSPDLIDKTLAELVDARLLRLTPGLTPSEDLFTMAQESLIQCWRRLVEWLEEKRDEHRRWLRLRSAAEQWRASHELNDLLWGGYALEEIENHPRLNLPELALERDFIIASRRSMDRAMLVRRIRWGSIATLIVVPLVVFYLQYTSYKDAKVTAERNAKQVLLKANADAATAKLTAVSAEKKKVEEEKRKVDAERAAKTVQLSQASTQFGQRAAGIEFQDNDRIGALVWYLEALKLATDKDSKLSGDRRAIFLDNYRSRLGVALRGAPRVGRYWAQRDLTHSAITKDGRWGFTLVKDATQLQLWSLESGESIALDHAAKVLDARFSDDSRYLVSGTEKPGPDTSAQPKHPILTLWTLPADLSKPTNSLSPTEWPIQENWLRIEKVAISSKAERLLAVVSNDTKGQDSSALFLLTKSPEQRTNYPIKLTLPEPGVVSSVEFSNDERAILIAANDPNGSNSRVTMALVDGVPIFAETGENDLQSPVNYASFVPTVPGSSRAYSFVTCSGKKDGNNGEAVLWRVESAGNIANVRSIAKWPQRGAVVQVTSSPDMRYVVTSSEDGSASMFELPSQLRKTPSTVPEWRFPHNGYVLSSAFSPDGHFLATACRDRKVRIWNVRTRELVTALECGGSPGQLSFTADGLRLFTQGGEDRAVLWDLLTDEIPPLTFSSKGSIPQAQLAADGRSVLTFSNVDVPVNGSQFDVWNVVNKDAPTRTWKGEGDLSALGEADVVAISPDGSSVARFKNKEYRLWKSGVSQVAVRPEDMVVKYACFNSNGSRLLAAGYDLAESRGIVKIWRTDEGPEGNPEPFSGHLTPVLYACFSPDGTRVLSCGGHPDQPKPTGEAFVWNIEKYDNKRSFHRLVGGHTEPVLFGAFSPDKTNLEVVTTSADNTACVWRLGSSVDVEHYMKLEVHTADVVFATYVPGQARQIVTAGKDGRAILWGWKETDNGKTTGETRTVLFHGEPLKQVVFSRNGRRFLTIADSPKVRVWDTLAAADPSGTVPPLIAILEHSGQMISAAAHPDEDHKFLALSYLENAATTSNTNTSPTGNNVPQSSNSSNSVLNVGYQVKEWDISPATEKLVNDAPSIVLSLAQREVNKESQTLQMVESERIRKILKDAPPDLRNARRPESTQERVHLWNRRAADQAEIAGEWYTAAWHLGQLIKAGDNSAELLNRQVVNYVRHGFYSQAIDNWNEVLPRDDAGPLTAVQQASFFARRGRAHAYLAFIEATDERKHEHAQQALEDFGRAISLDPLQTDWLIERAEFSRRLGNQEALLSDYSAAINKLEAKNSGKQLSELLKNRARIYIHSKKPQEAAADFQKAAEILAKSRDLSDALVTYNEGIEHDKGGAPAAVYAGRGRVLLELWRSDSTREVKNDAKAAISDFNKALKMGRDWTLFRDLATAHRLAGQLIMAEESFRSAIDQAQNQAVGGSELTKLYLGLAGVLEQKPDWQGASTILSKAIDVSSSPVDRLALLQRRATAHVKLGLWDLARQDFDAAIGLELNVTPWLIVQRATIFAEQGQWKNAEADLIRAREIFASRNLQDNVVLCLYQIAVVRLTSKDIPGYQETCKQLVQKYQDANSQKGSAVSPNLINNVAWTLALSSQSGFPSTLAVSLAEEGVVRARENEWSHNTLRTAYYRDGKYNEVLKSWAEFEKRKPREEDRGGVTVIGDYFIVAMTNRQLQKSEEARKWLKLGIERLERAKKESLANLTTFANEQLLPTWQKLELELLHQEAEQLLGPEAGS